MSSEDDADRVECRNSPTGRHRFEKKPCYGSWNHNDPGGQLYTHIQYVCIDCQFSFCDFSNAQKIEGETGWY